MNITNDQIQDAVNAAEQIASPLLSDRETLVIGNKELLALIAGANQWLQFSNEDVPDIKTRA